MGSKTYTEIETIYYFPFRTILEYISYLTVHSPVLRFANASQGVSFVLDYVLYHSLLADLLHRPSAIPDLVLYSNNLEQSPPLPLVESLKITLLGSIEDIQCKTACSKLESH